MTIIAYRDGSMAADRAVWNCDGRVVCGARDKIARMSNGSLLAAAGTASEIRRLHEFVERWMLDPSATPPAAADDLFAILVCPDRSVFLANKDMYFYGAADAPFYSMGSGGPFTMGALYAGATAAEAVSLTIRYTDCGSGGPNDVQVMRI